MFFKYPFCAKVVGSDVTQKPVTGAEIQSCSNTCHRIIIWKQTIKVKVYT